MQSMREKWTDERLDELNGRVDKLADRMDRGFERLSEEMNAGFGAIHRQMFQASIVLGAALFGVIATLLGVVAAVVTRL